MPTTDVNKTKQNTKQEMILLFQWTISQMKGILEHHCSCWISLVKTLFTRMLRLCNAFYKDGSWNGPLIKTSVVFLIASLTLWLAGIIIHLHTKCINGMSQNWKQLFSGPGLTSQIFVTLLEINFCISFPRLLNNRF